MAKKTGSRYTPRLEARNKAKTDVRAILMLSEVVAEHVGAIRGAYEKMVEEGFDANHEAVLACSAWCDETAKGNVEKLQKLDVLSEEILTALGSKSKWVDIELEVTQSLLAMSMLEGEFLALVAELTVKMQELIELFPDEAKEGYLATEDAAEKYEAPEEA